MSIIIPDFCGRGYTKCKDGACISISQLCDGTSHCSDRSDEDNRFCQGGLRDLQDELIIAIQPVDMIKHAISTAPSFISNS